MSIKLACNRSTRGGVACENIVYIKRRNAAYVGMWRTAARIGGIKSSVKRRNIGAGIKRKQNLAWRRRGVTAAASSAAWRRKATARQHENRAASSENSGRHLARWREKSGSKRHGGSAAGMARHQHGVAGGISIIGEMSGGISKRRNINAKNSKTR